MMFTLGTPIHTMLLHAIIAGVDQLNRESREELKRFIKSQYKEGAFVNRAGQKDVYYTVFGIMIMWVLGMKIDRKAISTYLRNIEYNALNEVDFIALRFVRTLLRICSVPLSWAMMIDHLPGTKKILEVLFSFDQPIHLAIKATPYQIYLDAILFGAAGKNRFTPEELLSRLLPYRCPDGGFTNIDSSQKTISTNATSAAYLAQFSCGVRDTSSAKALYKLHFPGGGFFASEVSPLPDLLSTATSLLVWACEGITPNEETKEYVVSLWTEKGGFSATLFDDESDVEYSFYGLLALGAIKIINK